jgi:hypothetical protein
MSHPRTVVRAAALLTLAAAALAACSDGNPVAGGGPPTDPKTPLTPSSAMLRCTADVGPRTVSCTSNPTGGVSADLVVGGQNMFVQLRSANVQLTGDVLGADVTVQNLLARPMGTNDGATPAASGTRVFFSSGPTVVSGSGTVTVANATAAPPSPPPGRSTSSTTASWRRAPAGS